MYTLLVYHLCRPPMGYWYYSFVILDQERFPADKHACGTSQALTAHRKLGQAGDGNTQHSGYCLCSRLGKCRQSKDPGVERVRVEQLWHYVTLDTCSHLLDRDKLEIAANAPWPISTNILHENELAYWMMISIQSLLLTGLCVMEHVVK